MDILCVEHNDFTLKFECSNYYAVLNKARSNYTNEHIISDYHWGESDIISIYYNNNSLSFENHTCHNETFFFDNTNYSIWVDFKDKVNDAKLSIYGENINDNFSFYKSKGILSGYINYQNDIGRSYIEIRYKKNNYTQIFRFEYDVLSTKLDYHDHWRKIISDVEEEYRMLSIDFLRRTYHGFSPSGKEDKTPEIIWWNIFRDKQRELIRAVKNIINQPRQRLSDKDVFLRADKLKQLTYKLENEFVENKNNEAHLYRVAVSRLNFDTVENRFLKFAILSISKKFNTLSSKIIKFPTTPNFLIYDIEQTKKALKSIILNPFFRNIGKFKGLKQENLTLQRATGYSEVYRIWLLLNMAYSLENGILKLETKDIANLYEIWCFIQVKNIVGKLLAEKNENQIQIDNQSRIELNKLFTYELQKGEFSRIIFKDKDVQLAEIIYNPEDKDGENLDLPNIESRTTIQKPDIVLQLTKDNIKDKIKLTYVFDAKYRISEHINGVGTPPGDAINQMHRYRDALYYKEYDGSDYTPNNLKKEVIGGYILFPGDGDIEKIQRERFFQSIKEVNIGAFPLKPGDNKNRILLENFIRDIINKRFDQLIGPDYTIAQKGLSYIKPKNIMDTIVLFGYCNPDTQFKTTISRHLYYVRLGDAKGSININSMLINSEYLILHDTKSFIGIYKITKDKTKIYSKEELKKQGFKPSHGEYYLCFTFHSLNIDDPLNGIDTSKINYNFYGKASFSPSPKYLSDIIIEKQ